MKVKELIALLEKQPQNVELEIYDEENIQHRIFSVEQYIDENGKTDCVFLNIE